MSVEEAYVRWGYGPARFLGQGMEGVVHHLSGGFVGKAWGERTPDQVRVLAAFYDELAGQDLPFATPRMVAVHEHRGQAVSIEQELTGTSLGAMVEAGRLSTAVAHRAVVGVVAAMGRTTAGPATRALPVLGEKGVLRRGGCTWGQDMAALVKRRTIQFWAVLERAVPDLEEVVAAVLSLLDKVSEPVPERIVHGDICPPNILVDGAGRPTAVLDWGFFTAAGDVAFDAATAAGFFDMYGPGAGENDRALAGLMVDELGQDRERMLLYRAVYALVSANVYSPTGEDGHFAWCVATFERRDVRSLLGLG